MKITEDVRKCATEQGIDEKAAPVAAMAENSKEFVENGPEVNGTV